MLVSAIIVLLAILLLISSIFRVSITNKTWNTPNGYQVCCIMSGRSNVFLITHGQLVVLVDTSLKSRHKKLDRKLEEHHISRIDYLVLTHSHFDHAGNAAAIQQKYGAKIIIHSAEKKYLELGLSPISNGSNHITRYLVGLAKFMGIKFPYEPCKANITIDKEYIVGNSNIMVIPTPGHTVGSISVAIDKEVLLVGDAISGIFFSSIFPPFANNTKQLIESWETIHSTGCQLIIPAHGSARTQLRIQRGINRLRQ